MDETICDEVIDVKETNFNEKNITRKTQSFYILHTFLINHCYIIGSCQYILLSDKIYYLKKFITISQHK